MARPLAPELFISCRLPALPRSAKPECPLTYQNVGIYRINATGSFNSSTWKGTGGVGENDPTGAYESIAA